jgi:cellulose synthase/poly-beta-1,6-N-acetylglucosamine synthase-like glycosyltransferase
MWTFMEFVFWVSFAGVAYAYVGYPLALACMGLIRRSTHWRADKPLSHEDAPRVSLIIPAHNEEDVIGSKLDNSLSLDYPGEIQVVVVSDGSTDETARIVGTFSDDSRLRFVDLPERKGKANALNVAVELAEGEIIVFSDASIILEERAIWQIVQPFADHRIGCVSGEDHIDGGGGEGLYGQYELYLRRQESRLGSIVGASGSFYAQRKELITRFPEGVAPDFLSVLATVRRGYRAVSTSKAAGYMTSVADSKGEYRRKIRTVIRGITALFQNKSLLNPAKYPAFSFFLFSHKLMRWYVPFFLIGLMVANVMLLEHAFYRVFFIAQILFYLVAIVASVSVTGVARSTVGKIALYFSASNVAILIAWYRYFRGVRQEIWSPSKRAS